MYTKRYVFLLIFVATACSNIIDYPKYQLRDGAYKFRQRGARYQKVLVYLNEDTLRLFSRDVGNRPIRPEPLIDQFFLKRSFDVDVITVPFKFRPIMAGLPRQLTTEFNGNVFVGYRMDRFKIRHEQTPIGIKQKYSHRAFSIGALGGLGSTLITSTTTNNQITDEYNGLILTRGIAVMIGANKLTVGIGVGWDYLTDRDKTKWIYQNKPWYGLTLGLNLN